MSSITNIMKEIRSFLGAIRRTLGVLMGHIWRTFSCVSPRPAACQHEARGRNVGAPCSHVSFIVLLFRIIGRKRRSLQAKGLEQICLTQSEMHPLIETECILTVCRLLENAVHCARPKPGPRASLSQNTPSTKDLAIKFGFSRGTHRAMVLWATRGAWCSLPAS